MPAGRQQPGSSPWAGFNELRGQRDLIAWVIDSFHPGAETAEKAVVSKIRISNIEQGMSNVERECGARGISTSNFDIACSIFDIHVFFQHHLHQCGRNRSLMQ